MLNGLFRAKGWRSARSWRGVTRCLSLALLLPLPQLAAAQAPGKNEGQSKPAAPKDDKDDGDEPKAKKPAGPDAKAENGDAADDMDQSTKIVPYEIFRDPKAEKLLGIDNYPQISKPAVAAAELLDVNGMAGGQVQMDLAVINRVVDAMVSKLTDHGNIQALIDPPPKLPPAAPANRAIQEATTALLEPIFLARGAAPRNLSFLTSYNRILSQKLTPLLKNHLIPRVQAMIVLGQSGSADLLPIYVAQIKEPNQTVWVKLWALEGITNVIEDGGRLSGENQAQTAKIVADFLSTAEDLPWPVQLRGLEALTALRQGYEPAHPERAAMASAAMKLLADSSAKPEVRSEAARALGLMQITTAVRKYNFPLVAHSVGLLAADLGTQVNSFIPERVTKSATGKAVMAPDAAKPAAKTLKGKAKAKDGQVAAPAVTAPPPTPANPVKAKFLTALLIGPVYQAFEGVPGPRGDSGGLIRSANGDGVAYSQQVFELVKAVAKGSVDLISAGSRQINDKKKELEARVQALSDFLEKKAPTDRHLVQGGQDYPLAQASAK
jgi:hypothetical protein